MNPKSDPEARATLRLTRRFAAPREAVFAALTRAEALAEWFGPEGTAVKNVSVDLRPGGTYFMEFHNAEGHYISLSGTYREVVPPERLVFTWIWDRGEYGGLETLVTLTLREARSGTELELVHEALLDETARGRHEDGWSGCFDCLDRYLAAA